MRKSLGRFTAAGLGALLLAGAASAAFAQDNDNPPEEPVGTNLKLTVGCEDGYLLMDVDNGDVAIREDTVSPVPAGQRWFDGQLGNVVIRDTRCERQLEAGAFWWVEGQATDFVAQAPLTPADDIDVEYLGWEPSLVRDGQEGVSAGEEIGSTLDTLPFTPPADDPNRGLGGEEFLVSMSDASDPDFIAVDEWTASAKMKLKAPAQIADGEYISVLTLTLFEYNE